MSEVSSAASQVRFLIVSPDTQLRQALARTLRESGRQFLGAATYAEASCILLPGGSSEVALPDVVIVEDDNSLWAADPDQGVRFLELVHERYPQILRIVLVDEADRGVVLMRNDVAYRFITKPWDNERVRVYIAGLLAGISATRAASQR